MTTVYSTEDLTPPETPKAGQPIALEDLASSRDKNLISAGQPISVEDLTPSKPAELPSSPFQGADLSMPNVETPYTKPETDIEELRQKNPEAYKALEAGSLAAQVPLQYAQHAIDVSPFGTAIRLGVKEATGQPVPLEKSPATGFWTQLLQSGLDTGLTIAQLSPLLPAGLTPMALGFGATAGGNVLAEGGSAGKAAWEAAKTTGTTLAGGTLAGKLAAPFDSALAKYAVSTLGFAGGATSTNAAAKAVEYFHDNQDSLMAMDPSDAAKKIAVASGGDLIPEFASNVILGALLDAKRAWEQTQAAKVKSATETNIAEENVQPEAGAVPKTSTANTAVESIPAFDKGPGAASPEDINPVTGTIGVTKAERAKYADIFGPEEKTTHPPLQDVHDLAYEKVQSDPEYPQRLAAEIVTSPRPPSAEEIRVLNIGAADAKNNYYKAKNDADAISKALEDQSISPEVRTDLVAQKDAAEGRMIEWEQKWSTVFKASKEGLSKWGELGRASQGLVDEQFEFELPRLKFDAETVKGTKLSVEEAGVIDGIASRGKKNYDDRKAKESSDNEIEAVKESAKAFDSVVKEKRPTSKEYTVEEALARIQKLAESGIALEDMRNPLNELSRSLYRSGIRDRDAVMSKVHEAVKTLVEPKATFRQVRDIHSGYGKSSPLTTDEAKIQISQWNSEHQNLAKIEGMLERAEAPKYTGPRRVPASAEAKRLTKQVNKLMKDLNIKPVDREAQFKSFMETTKNRLWGQIVALDKAIMSGEAIPKAKRGVEYDSEAKTLVMLRDALKEHYNEMFPRETTLSQDQLLQRAEKATEKWIKEYERRIEARDFSSFKKESNTPESIKLEALRAQLSALKAQYSELKKLDQSSAASENLRALAAYKTRLRNSMADMKTQMANGEITPRKKTSIVKDSEALNLSIEHKEIQKEWRRFLENLRWQNLSAVKKSMESAVIAVDAARTIKTSFDLSGILRQGAFSSLGHPLQAAKSFVQMLSAMRSIEAEFKIDQSIKNHPSYNRAIEAGLELTGVGESLHMMEENYMSRIAQKIPGVGMSERAFRTYLNTLRFNTYLQLEKNLMNRGLYSLDRMKAIANLLNVGSGRGNVSGLDFLGKNFGRNFAVVANRFFFAPRFALSRAQLLAGQPFFHGDLVAKRMVATEYAKALTGLSLILGIGLMAGGKLHLDPRIPGFGSIEIGGKYFNYTAGISQWAVLMSRVFDGARRRITGKRSVPIGDLKLAPLSGGSLPFNIEPPTAAEWAISSGTGGMAQEVPQRFLRQKLAPLPQVTYDLSTGTNAIGEKQTVPRILVDIPKPLEWSNIEEILKEEGVPSNAFGILQSFLGVDVQTRSNKAKAVLK